jgi:hypothetical protein
MVNECLITKICQGYSETNFFGASLKEDYFGIFMKSGISWLGEGLSYCVRDCHIVWGNVTLCVGLSHCVRDCHIGSGTVTLCQGLSLCVRDCHIVWGTVILCEGLSYCVRDCHIVWGTIILSSQTQLCAISEVVTLVIRMPEGPNSNHKLRTNCLFQGF